MLDRSEERFGKVAVLLGGDSTEREISLLSGNEVLKSLLRSGVDAHGIDAGKDLLEVLKKRAIDRVFIMLHGRNGEDGKVQAALDQAGIPYTGSGVEASELTMDKVRCKELWLTKGYRTPEFVVLDEEADYEGIIKRFGTVFVKPVNEGSSIGIGKASTVDELAGAYENASQYDDVVIAEQWINGPEFTVAVLGEKTLPTIELKTKNEFYDYDAKYEAEDTQYLCPSNLDENKKEEIETLSRLAYDAAGCRGWGRVDLMQDELGAFWLLEVNTIPGMTDHSLVPIAALEAGISFDELVLEILESSELVRGES